MEKKLGVVKMRGVHTVFEAEGGYEVSSVKDEHDRNGRIEFIPFFVVTAVEHCLRPGAYDLEEIYGYLRARRITITWDYHYGRDGSKQKFYLRKILCVLIVLGRVQWEQVGKKYLYTLNIKCPECESVKIAVIQYGLPTSELIAAMDKMEKRKKDRFILGGCVVKPEKYFCHQCKHSW
jgi:hypothetical protein